MIVCLCRRVSDRDIAAAVQSGVDNFEILQDRTGVASCCGCCHDCAREAFHAARSRSPSAQQATAQTAGEAAA